MAPYKHGYYQSSDIPLPPRSWANEKDIMANSKGWVKRNTELEVEKLKNERIAARMKEFADEKLKSDTQFEGGELGPGLVLDSQGRPGIPRYDLDGNLVRVLRLHLCDGCNGGVHDHCYRIICNCPCYWDQRYGENYEKLP